LAKGGRRLWQTTTSDGVMHALSIVDDPKAIETIAWAFQGEPTSTSRTATTAPPRRAA
jgi:hypothetical protein